MVTAEQDNNSETVERLFSIGAHYGYTRSRRDPSMAPFVFGTKNRIDILDLEQTAKLLENAKEYMCSLGAQKKTVLFVSGKQEARGIVEGGAKSLGMPYVAGRWIGGTFTNFQQIKKRLARLRELKEEREKGSLERYTKREQLDFDREITDLEGHFSGLLPLEGLPTAVFVVDTKHERAAVREARKMGIPVVALQNSDCDLKDAAYSIVANDASVRSVSFFVDELVAAYKEGLARAEIERKEPESASESGGEEG